MDYDQQVFLVLRDAVFLFLFFLNNLHYFFRLCSFSVPEDFEPEIKSEEGSGASEVLYQPPEITPLYGVTARLEPLFQDAHKKLMSGIFFFLSVLLRVL